MIDFAPCARAADAATRLAVPPPLTPANLGLDVGQMRAAVSCGELAIGLVRRVIFVPFGVFDWFRADGERETFRLLHLIRHRDLDGRHAESYHARRMRHGRIDRDHLGGLTVQGPDGRRYVIDEGNALTVLGDIPKTPMFRKRELRLVTN